VHPAEDYDVCRCSGCGLGQPERISDEVGNILNLRNLVVVRENDSVLFLLQPQNLLCQFSVSVELEALGHGKSQ